jgi:hypothetical protein
MLGEQYGELKGKVIGQRVLDVEGSTIETSVLASGTIKGMSVQEMITVIGTPTAEKGVIHGVGKGVLSTGGELNNGEAIIKLVRPSQMIIHAINHLYHKGDSVYCTHCHRDKKIVSEKQSE